MGQRLDFSEELRDVLGSDNVYFNPPEGFKLKYPCIIYEIDDIMSLKANDRNYHNYIAYSVMVIDTDPDSKIYEDLMNRFPMCSFRNTYPADNLNHFVLLIYY